MSRSIRLILSTEAKQYRQSAPFLTASSPSEIRVRLVTAGLDPMNYCYAKQQVKCQSVYHVWEDRVMKDGLVSKVPFGQAMAVLKRSQAEHLYITVKRNKSDRFRAQAIGGAIVVTDTNTDDTLTSLSLPIAGGKLVAESGSWDPDQVAHFVNAILLRRMSVEEACEATEALYIPA